MTPFGAILIVSLFVLLVQREQFKTKLIRLLIFCFTIGAGVQIGCVFKVNDFDISYSFFLEIIITIFAFFWAVSTRQRFAKTSTTFFLIFIGCSIVSILSLLTHTYDKMVVTRTVSWDQYVLGIAQKELLSFSSFNVQEMVKPFLLLLLLMIISRLSFFDQKKFLCSTADGIKVFLCYGALEWVVKNVLNSSVLYDIQQSFFGVTSATQTDLRMRGSSYSLQGLTKEPSLYASQLFLWILLLLVQQRLTTKNNKWWIILSVFLLVNSMSLSSVMFGGSILLIYLIDSNFKKSKYKNFLLIVAVLALFLLPIAIVVLQDTYIGARIQNLLQDIPNMISGTWRSSINHEVSNRARFLSIWEGIQIIMDCPLFGVGPGTIASFSEVILFAASNGILSLAFWLLAGPLALKVTKKRNYHWMIFCWLLPYFFCMGESPFWSLSAVITILTLRMLCVENSQIENRVNCL